MTDRKRMREPERALQTCEVWFCCEGNSLPSIWSVTFGAQSIPCALCVAVAMRSSSFCGWEATCYKTADYSYSTHWWQIATWRELHAWFRLQAFFVIPPKNWPWLHVDWQPQWRNHVLQWLPIRYLVLMRLVGQFKTTQRSLIIDCISAQCPEIRKHKGAVLFRSGRKQALQQSKQRRQRPKQQSYNRCRSCN